MTEPLDFLETQIEPPRWRGIVVVVVIVLLLAVVAAIAGSAEPDTPTRASAGAPPEVSAPSTPRPTSDATSTTTSIVDRPPGDPDAVWIPASRGTRPFELTVGSITVHAAVAGFFSDGPPTSFPMHSSTRPDPPLIAHFAMFRSDAWGPASHHFPVYTVNTIEGMTEDDLRAQVQSMKEHDDPTEVGSMYVSVMPMEPSNPQAPIWTTVAFSPHPGTWVQVHGRLVDRELLLAVARSIR